jgi:HKD family nuclease
VKTALDEQLHPDGYEVTFTSGEVAEHTVPHAHVSVIPRFREPIAERQPPLATGGEHDPLSQHLWPLFSTATEIAIVAAFVTETGLELLEEWVTRALRAGAQLRIVTGDYLAFNQVDALRLLLVWSQRDAHARDKTPELPHRGQLRVRVVETAQPDGTERAFHPKCWLFESPSFGVAFVGSSNLSCSVLQTGIEWNLRVEQAIDPIAYSRVRVRPQRWRGGGKDKGPVRPSYCPFFGAPSATTATATSLTRGPLLPLCRRSLRSW